MEAKKLVDIVFDGIKSANTKNELEKLFSIDKLESNRMKKEKYPPIKFEINYSEIKKFLDNENNLLKDSSLITDPLAKILYALVWKNGDLQKIKHIVEGIRDIDSYDEDMKNDGLVFYQFGKYLTKKNNEPIIDQHVIRAFAVRNAETYKVDIDTLRRMSLLNSETHRGYINDYKTWLISDELQSSLKKETDYIYYIDQILFALGKTIKLKK
ncbi:hypothetical protein FYC62_01550 [Pedobacter aquae]|uniref:Uncharacterized protein n=1 Tax=Pedobacter aquae TaxID=2605747 RepID=A0A5C0VCI7_9SPHI|nr:hypothetical protein [Pedobacter aquae]QEK50495.1 hypothetical protein FYC62_01550 [Pedobacter aquae]